MFAKIFYQIFDSTIAENWQHRHVFMDLLVLADVDGCVNKTASAIARQTNVPLEIVQAGIDALSAPDPDSQNKEHEGRRLIPIEEGRAWGWRIVSYQHYREMRDAEARRLYHRDYRRKERAAKKAKNGSGLKRKKRGAFNPRACAFPDAPPGE
jgi:hypothetical protein